MSSTGFPVAATRRTSSQVRHLAGADLVAGHAEPLEPLDCLQREDRAEELDAGVVAGALEGRPLLVVESRAAEVLPARLALEVGRRGRVPRRLGLRVVELELDRVGAALGGDLREPDRVAEAAVVVHARLGDDVHPLHPGDRSRVPLRRREVRGTLAR